MLYTNPPATAAKTAASTIQVAVITDWRCSEAHSRLCVVVLTNLSFFSACLVFWSTVSCSSFFPGQRESSGPESGAFDIEGLYLFHKDRNIKGALAPERTVNKPV